MAEAGDEVPHMLLPCTICNRTFKPESLQKHIKICEKNANKKRKTFDSSKQRNQVLAEFLPVIPKKAEKSASRKLQSAWKEKHLEFVRAVRQARGISEVAGKRSLPLAVAQTRSAIHEKCPHCERNFGPKAFDRHIEWCKEQKARIPKSPASITAKERLEARIKYRAPLAKSKRTLTREKYSALRGGRTQEPTHIDIHSSINCSTLTVSSSNTDEVVTTSSVPNVKPSGAQSLGSAASSQCTIAQECLSSLSSGLQHNNDAQSCTVQCSSSSPTQSLPSTDNSLSNNMQNKNSSPTRSMQRNNSFPSHKQRVNNSPPRNIQNKNSSPCCSLQSSNSSLTHGVHRRSVSQGSTPQWSSSPTKRSSIRKYSVSGKGKPVTEVQSSQKQNSADVNLQDIFSSSCNIARLNPSRKSSTKNVPTSASVVAAPRKKSSNKEVKSVGVSAEETYDPYVSAERQMMELLSHEDWSKKSGKEIEQQEQQQQQEQQEQQMPAEQSIQPTLVSSISPAPCELRTSPTSAFTKYSPTKPQTNVTLTVHKSALDYQSLHSDDLIISGHNPSSLPSPHNVSLSSLTSEYDENNDNVNNNTDLTISLSNLSLCSIPNFDFNFEFDISAANRNTNRSKKYRKKLENAALALQQSVSLYHPGPLAKDEVQPKANDADNSLLQITESKDISSRLHPGSSYSMSSLDPTLSAIDNSEEARKLHELSKDSAVIIHVEDELTSQDSHINRRSVANKMSGDSAYSSLNRRSPLADVCSQALERHLEMTLDADHHCLSSSGSESSLLPISSVQVSRHGGRSPLFPSSSPVQSNSGQWSPPKMSKFCHECGSKYPITLAKFCCECGVKRLLI